MIEVSNVTHGFGPPGSGNVFVVLDDVSFTIKDGSIVSLLGPSGCGKTTLLRIIDGLIQPLAGEIRIDGAVVRKPSTDRAMVFQEFALMPWRTVVENVRFGLEMQRWRGEDLDERARRYVRLVGLEGFEHYRPHQLSGGMRQRVGIARALAVDPDILLLDEPFGALDAQTRESMGDELLKIWEQNKKTALFVTHSIDEAIFLGDIVVIMSKGPGRIVETIPIELARPRAIDVMDTAAFVEYRRRIRQRMTRVVSADA